MTKDQPGGGPRQGPVDLQKRTTRELLSLYARVLIDLKRRRVIRSENNPVADYAEGLVAKAFDLKLAAKSSAGYDATDDAGNRYEIKARRNSLTNRSCLSSAIRNLECGKFEYLIGVIFESDFNVLRACRVPWKVVMETAGHRTHVNAHVLNLNAAFMSRPDVEDITHDLQMAQLEDTR